MYKAVAFDFFGVIQNDQYSVWLSHHGYKKQGKFSDLSKVADKDLITMQEYYATLSEYSGIPSDQIKSEFEEPQVIDNNVIQIIKEVHRKYKTALASNSNSQYLENMMDKEQLTSLFDEIIISGQIGFSKPSPEFFENLIKYIGYSAHEIIFIDDNLDNVLASQSLDIKSLRFTDAQSLRSDLFSLGLNI